MTELKTCYCGSTAKVVATNETIGHGSSSVFYHVACESCFVKSDKFTDWGKISGINEAIAQWNKRPSPWVSDIVPECDHCFVNVEVDGIDHPISAEFCDGEFYDHDGGVIYPLRWMYISE